MRTSILLVLTVILSSCFTLSSALFLPWLKALKGHSYGGGGYGTYGGYGGYGGYSGYGGYGGYGGSYGRGYPQYGSRHRTSSRRTGRTYSDIARVINPDPYIGGGGFIPRAPFAPYGR